MTSAPPRLIPIGASVGRDGVTYRAWAPGHRSVSVVGGTNRTRVTLKREADGYWSAHDANGRAGDRYGFVVDEGPVLPDPASRSQPDGVHGLSACIDPTTFQWTAAWKRPGWNGQVIYELHVGTFTDEGTFRSAIPRLDHIRDLGVDAIELMPLADFPGNRNWGYDGVALYAPARCYGPPDDLRALVDAAHARGLAVILDVVYNHLGPVGNYLPQFSSSYFHSSEQTPWGAALNLDGGNKDGVRNFLLGNAARWLDEFRFDGLRVDATHAIIDRSPRHFLAELADVVHARGAFLIAEDDRNALEILHNDAGQGHGFEAAWSDDFHHQLRVILTGVREAYFASYPGTLAALADTLAHGWFYRGQPYPFWHDKNRGAECRHLDPAAFVLCVENHDQVGNRAGGERLEHLVSRDAYRAAALLLCLSPYPPMLFMGQEWASAAPFLFFTDHAGEQGKQVSEGRKREFAQAGLNAGVSEVPDPQNEQTFQRSKLDWTQIEGAGSNTLALFQAALRARHQVLDSSTRSRAHWNVEASAHLLAIRYARTEGDYALVFSPAPNANDAALPSLLLLPKDCCWRVLLVSSEQPATPPEENWSPQCSAPSTWWLRLQRTSP